LREPGQDVSGSVDSPCLPDESEWQPTAPILSCDRIRWVITEPQRRTAGRTLPGSSTQEPEGSAGPEGSTTLNCDRFGRHPLPSRRIQMTADCSAIPSCDGTRLVITERLWRTTELRLGAQHKNPKIQPTPRSRPGWAATDLEDVNIFQALEYQDTSPEGEAASIEPHDPHSHRYSPSPGQAQTRSTPILANGCRLVVTAWKRRSYHSDRAHCCRLTQVAAREVHYLHSSQSSPLHMHSVI